MQQHISRGNLVVHCHQEMLLTADTADVALLIAEAYILDGSFAIQMLSALLQVNGEAVPGIMVVHILFNININAADCIYKTLKALKVDHDIIIDLDTQKLLDSLLRQLLSAIGIGMVNLIPAMALNTHTRITRHRKQRSSLRLAIEHHHEQRIAAPHIIRALIYTHYDDVLL